MFDNKVKRIVQHFAVTSQMLESSEVLAGSSCPLEEGEMTLLQSILLRVIEQMRVYHQRNREGLLGLEPPPPLCNP